LGEWVIMPNHIHGILVFDKQIQCDTINVVETPNLGVSTGNANKYWKPGNLGVIVNQYKRKCTIESHKINSDFAWQSRFHDRIIRNKNELKEISEYIRFNPQNCQNDDYF